MTCLPILGQGKVHMAKLSLVGTQDDMPSHVEMMLSLWMRKVML